MHIPHPLNAIPDGRPTWAVFAVCLALALVFGWLTKRDLKTKEAPWDAVSLELTWDEDKARRIVTSWQGKADEVRKHLQWDTYFIFAYSTLLALGCVMAARKMHAPGSFAYNFFLLVAWLPWVAGVLDFIENDAIKAMLGGFSGGALPLRAFWCAFVKFCILFATSGYALAGLIARLF